MTNDHDKRGADVMRRTNFLLDAELTGKHASAFKRSESSMNHLFGTTHGFSRKVCNLCGENHYTEECTLLTEIKPVKDTPTISRARRTLPSNLNAVALADGTTTIIACSKLERGTHFGPFQAQLTTDLHPAVMLPLKIISKPGTDGYYLDTTDEENCNWMCLVAPASTASEQNLICYDMKQSIYFTAIRDILPGEELRVWYALYYGLKLQALPLADDSDTEESIMDIPDHDSELKLKVKTNAPQDLGRELMESLAQHLPAHSLGARIEKDRWHCKFCDTQEINVALYAKHLMSHYRPKCELCNRRFYSEKALKKHHENRHVRRQTARANNACLPDREISSLEERCERLPDDNHSLQTPTKTWIENDLKPCEESNVEISEDVENLSNQKIDFVNYNEFDPQMPIDKENWMGINQQQSEESTVETNDEAKRPDDKVNLINYNDFDPGLSVEKENWTANAGNQMEESNVERAGDEEKLINDNVDLVSCSLDPGIAIDRANEGVITIENINTSEIIQTQLVLAEDGSVVYHVANIPEGILTAEMENLGLLVVENATHDSRLEESVGDSVLLQESVWNAGTSQSVEPNMKEHTKSEILENAPLPSETQENIKKTESLCVDNKSDVESNEAVALILLNAGVVSPLEHISNTEKEQSNNMDTSSEQLKSVTSDAEMRSKIDAALQGSLENPNGSAAEEDEDFQQNNSPVTEEMEQFKPDSASVASKKVKSEGPFACDICSKVFVKSAYLYRHLRKHTGEFTCVNCLAVFARKENLQSHPCSRPASKYPCQICGKKFSAKKYLQRHKPLHTGEFTCEKCKRPFVSKLSLVCHRCPTSVADSANNIECTICEQNFPDQTKLKAHLRHHSETSPDGSRSFLPSTQATRKQRRRKTKTSAKPYAQKASESSCTSPRMNSVPDPASGNESGLMQESPSGVKDSESPDKDVNKRFICEICGSIFKSFSSMKTHRFLHGERRFECKTCGKRFHRKDVLQEHIAVHQSPQLPCAECGKKFKTKKSLEVHMMIHAGAKRFTCDECGKEFYQKGNLIKHQRVHTPPADRIFPCEHCHKTFISREYLSMHTLEHTQGKIFQCPSCSKSFVKKHLLDSHLQTVHSNRAFLCRYCNNVMRHRHSARRHLEQQHPDQQTEWSQQGFVDSMLAEVSANNPLLLNNAAAHSGQPYSLRRQHFEATSTQSNIDGSRATNGPDQSGGNMNENQHLSVEDIATYDLQQQMELLADPLLSSNQQLQLDEVNVVPVPFEHKKPGEEILLEVVGSQLQEGGSEDQTGSGTAIPISITSDSVSKGDNAHVTIGGNTYILQDQVIFEQDEITSGDILLYVLDSGNQQ